jgi:hypothetical protein
VQCLEAGADLLFGFLDRQFGGGFIGAGRLGRRAGLGVPNVMEFAETEILRAMVSRTRAAVSASGRFNAATILPARSSMVLR